MIRARQEPSAPQIGPYCPEGALLPSKSGGNLHATLAGTAPVLVWEWPSKGRARLQSDQELGRQNSSVKIVTHCYICFFVDSDLRPAVDLGLSFALPEPTLRANRTA